MNAAQSIHVVVSKEEILACSTARMESEIDRKLQQLVDFGEYLETLSSDRERFVRMAQHPRWSDRITNLDFSVDGYNEDSRELEDIPEVAQWARTWMKKQPYAPFFLSAIGLTLLRVLVVGSIRVGKTRIPDAESAAADQFETDLEAGLEYLNRQYGHLYPVRPFLFGRRMAMERAKERQRKMTRARPWWRFW